jgi:hypothetical protein
VRFQFTQGRRVRARPGHGVCLPVRGDVVHVLFGAPRVRDVRLWRRREPGP